VDLTWLVEMQMESSRRKFPLLREVRDGSGVEARLTNALAGEVGEAANPVKGCEELRLRRRQAGESEAGDRGGAGGHPFSS
jgi:hypothetical protein